MFHHYLKKQQMYCKQRNIWPRFIFEPFALVVSGWNLRLCKFQCFKLSFFILQLCRGEFKTGLQKNTIQYQLLIKRLLSLSKKKCVLPSYNLVDRDEYWYIGMICDSYSYDIAWSEQYHTIWHDTISYAIVWYRMIWCNIAWYDMILYDMIQYCIINMKQ